MKFRDFNEIIDDKKYIYGKHEFFKLVIWNGLIVYL